MLRFLKNSGIFLLGAVLSRMVAFLMLPVYTAQIPLSDFGYYDLTLTYANLACEAVFMNLWVVLLRQMYDEAINEVEVLRASALVFAGATVVFCGGAGLLWWFFNPKNLWYAVAFGFVQALDYMYKSVCRGRKRNWDFAVSGILAAVVIAGANLFFLLVLEWDYRSLYIATILGYAVEMVYVEIRVGVVRRMLRASSNGARVLPIAWILFLAAMPVGLNAVAYWLINSVNRAVVSYRLDFAANGVFATAMRFGSLMMLVITALNYAWQDQAFRRGSQDGAFFSKAASFYAAAMLGGAAVLMPIVRVVFPLFVDSSYGASLSVIPFALGVSAFSGFSNFLVNIFYALRRNALTLYAVLIAGAVNMAVVFPAVDHFGAIGACASTMIGYSAGILYMLVRLRQDIAMRVSWVLPLSALVAVALAGVVFARSGIAGNGLLAVGMLTAAGLGAYRLAAGRRA